MDFKKARIDFSALKGIFLKKKKNERTVSQSEEIALFVSGLIGTRPKDLKLFLQAFTHKSYPTAAPGFHNERLEFLGDSVLNLSVSHLLYNLYPDDDEGALSQMRSFLTSRSNMNDEARRMGLDKVLRVAVGTNLDNSDILGNSLEAFLGVLYLERGMEFTSKFIQKRLIISRKNMETVSLKEEDFKTEFIILMQKNKIPYSYKYLGNRLTKEGTISHKFQLLVGADDEIIAEGEAGNKKAAHQLISRIALEKITLHPDLLEEFSSRPVPPAGIKA